MAKLSDLAAHYVIDEWKRWQQGGCLDYARALIRTYPNLRFGTIYDEDDFEQHHFAHDDTYAYDSAGRHPLPYLGIDGSAARCQLDEDPEWYDAPDEDEIAAAQDHIARHASRVAGN